MKALTVMIIALISMAVVSAGCIGSSSVSSTSAPVTSHESPTLSSRSTTHTTSSTVSSVSSSVTHSRSQVTSSTSSVQPVNEFASILSSIATYKMRDNTTISFEVIQENGTANVCKLHINASDSYYFNLTAGNVYQNSTYTTTSCSGGKTVSSVKTKMVNGTVYIKRGREWLNTGTASMKPLLTYNPVSLSLRLINDSECHVDGDVLNCSIDSKDLRSIVSYYLGLPRNLKVRNLSGSLTLERYGSGFRGRLIYEFDVVYRLGSGVGVEQKGVGKEEFLIIVR